MNPPIKLHEVLTLEEAARFLRVPKKNVQALAEAGKLPARRVGDSWRFFKPAIEDWLRCKEPLDGKAALLAQAGRLKDDPTLLPMLAGIYKARGRPEVEEGSND
jgi:excisionase family DNA binding protein